jgi:hypothetical protein
MKIHAPGFEIIGFTCNQVTALNHRRNPHAAPTTTIARHTPPHFGPVPMLISRLGAGNLSSLPPAVWVAGGDGGGAERLRAGHQRHIVPHGPRRRQRPQHRARLPVWGALSRGSHAEPRAGTGRSQGSHEAVGFARGGLAGPCVRDAERAGERGGWFAAGRSFIQAANGREPWHVSSVGESHGTSLALGRAMARPLRWEGRYHLIAVTPPPPSLST